MDKSRILWMKEHFYQKGYLRVRKYTSVKMQEQINLSTLDESYLHLRHIMKEKNYINIYIVNTLPISIKIKWTSCAVLDKDFDQLIQLFLCSQQENIYDFQVSRQSTNDRRLLDQTVLSRIFNKFRNLRYLSIKKCSIGQNGLKIINKLGNKLEDIILVKNDITANQIRALFADSNFQKLNCLDLESNPFGNRGLLQLAKTNLPNLQTIFICDCGVTLDGLKLFTKANWPINNVIYVSSLKNDQLQRIGSLSAKQLIKKFCLIDKDQRNVEAYQTWMVDISTKYDLQTLRQDCVSDVIIMIPYKQP